MKVDTKADPRFFIFATAHFLKQLPTHIAHIAKATRANAETKALSKSAILPAFYSSVCLLLCIFAL